MTADKDREIYISIDVETAGPNPSGYSLLAIGACLVDNPERSFYVEIQPTSDKATDEALAISNLSLDSLSETGVPPDEAMARFEAWVKAEVGMERRPVFVGFNAPFDWMFVNDYFIRYLGHNPFGHTALDIKAFFMGLTGVPWAETSYRKISAYTGYERRLSHHALQDAQDQAAIFKQLLHEPRRKTASNLPSHLMPEDPE